jgi:Rod binding domain-containing protein
MHGSSPVPAHLAASPLLPAAKSWGKGAQAARDFEAQLIATVLESLEKTFASVPGQDSVAGADNYNYLGTQALSSAIAAGGGFGIATLIERHFGGANSGAPDSTAPNSTAPR